MEPISDYALAQMVAEKLNGKFWQVTPGDWWVVVEGISSQKLVVLTNDPLGIAFSPKELTIGMSELRSRVLLYLRKCNVICEDGSWAMAG